ncbi:MAG: hypothetical protein WA584_12350 [Pyrinomonadaceae bacterium]
MTIDERIEFIKKGAVDLIRFEQTFNSQPEHGNERIIVLKKN